MTMLGKSLSEYVRFQRMILGLILAVGLARLLLSLAGVSNDTAKFLSMTVVALASLFYYGIRVRPKPDDPLDLSLADLMLWR